MFHTHSYSTVIQSNTSRVDFYDRRRFVWRDQKSTFSYSIDLWNLAWLGKPFTCRQMMKFASRNRSEHLEWLQNPQIYIAKSFWSFYSRYPLRSLQVSKTKTVISKKMCTYVRRCDHHDHDDRERIMRSSSENTIENASWLSTFPSNSTYLKWEQSKGEKKC